MATAAQPWSRGTRPEETFRYLATSAMRRNGTRACLRGSSRIRARQTEYGLVVPSLGRRMSLTYEVIGFVPDREVLLAAANDVLRPTDRIVVTGAYGQLLNGQSCQPTRCCRARR